MSEPPLLYRVKEVAALLSISRSRAYELVASGEIESVRIGSSLRVPREALDFFVAGLRGDGSLGTEVPRETLIQPRGLPPERAVSPAPKPANEARRV